MFIHYANPAHASAVKLLPSMERKDADVHAVAVLLNNVQFHSQSDDLIYSVHKNYTVLDALEYKNRTIYRADHPLIAVGCTQQVGVLYFRTLNSLTLLKYQFCVATSSEEQCSDLNALPSDAKSLHLSGASAIQIAALQLLIEFSLFYPLGRISQPNAALKMGSHDQILEKLPDTEWITEVKAWESNVWAALQTGISDYAIGPSARARISDGDIHKPNSTGENQLCGTQRMRKSGSFV